MTMFEVGHFDIQIENEDDPTMVELEAFGLVKDGDHFTSDLTCSYARITMSNPGNEWWGNEFVDSDDLTGIALFPEHIRDGITLVTKLASETQRIEQNLYLIVNEELTRQSTDTKEQ